ncbi:nucleoside triphosphate pyrophosphohydrolase [Pseudidiomarina sp. 1APP75-32.1]|uniref:Nucleoside triphosphate pyrophosphohydrolase n=2 Tax=Pseudidiomarina terrestris TaxID=2820060 RepID=A0AAW7QVZ5_9GAMM|nr:nucleoside triphosphate pyrophosphohydrolase [Pseudidiomarina sp. 1APP75-32.1]MDN7128685.1 nucleoside triphosphate pyrophosphohydrolase [Pseudidiomarina sp. 1APR75-15]MDN7137727.1 nucleoside triphosphate pyrophosphohydrolase [Pseudidiomarina sp. 1ASP75-14]
MRRLRDPETGCPWDLKQSLSSLIPYTIEEAYEVAAAITEGDDDAIKDELGDLLFQVVFYTQLTQEQGKFSFDEVAQQTADKLIRRHPHVFGETQAQSDAEIKAQWEQIKQQERADQGADASVFAGIPDNLPSILLAQKLQKRAANVGFDWPSVTPVLDKIQEEIAEVEAELNAAELDQQALADEIGDVLFAVVNLARHAQVNPEHALRRTNLKFKQRFQAIERRLAEQGRSAEQLSLAELEDEWQQVKRRLQSDEF